MKKITQQTTRLPEDKNLEIKEAAENIGSSYNSFVNILLDIGMRVYKSEPSFEVISSGLSNPR